MEIKTQIVNRDERVFDITYRDEDLEKNLMSAVIHGVHSFYGDKMVIVYNSVREWTLPGGGIESGETYKEASIREIKEEANIKVLHQECIGYQDISISDENRVVRQVRIALQDNADHGSSSSRLAKSLIVVIKNKIIRYNV